jgi:hypothetical protein
MPAGLKRASRAVLDSPVKPGNDGVGEEDVFIMMRPLIFVFEVFELRCSRCNLENLRMNSIGFL